MTFKKLLLLGEGAYSKVYLCRYKQMTKACKIIKIENDVNELKSIIREAYLLKSAKHKNINTASDIFILNDEIHYIMDVSSHTLSVQMKLWLNSDHIFNLKEVKNITKQLLDGVKYLHDNGIVHRDLKPENILIDGNFNLKITDFGLAKLSNGIGVVEERELTLYVQTLWYRAPEVFLLKEYNNKADMWSIGCILYEIATCRTDILFYSENSRESVLKMVDFFNLDPSERISKHYKLGNYKKTYTPNYLNEQYKIYTKILDQDLFNLIKNLLIFHPAIRYSCYEALTSPFFSHNKKLPPILPIKAHRMQIPNELKKIDNTYFQSNRDAKYLYNEMLNVIKS